MPLFCTVLRSEPSFASCGTVGKETDVVLLTKRLKPDLGILVAVDRFTTGATAHSLRGLANAYTLACENGQPSRAEEYRTRLLRELRGHASLRELANHRLRFTPKLPGW